MNFSRKDFNFWAATCTDTAARTDMLDHQGNVIQLSEGEQIIQIPSRTGPVNIVQSVTDVFNGMSPSDPDFNRYADMVSALNRNDPV